MSESTPAGSSENKLERKNEIDFKVGFLFRCHSTAELLSDLKNLSEWDKIHLLLLPEFVLNTGEILSSLYEISQAARDRAVDVIMASNERNSGIPWKNRERELKGSGIAVSGTYPEDA